MTVDSPLFQMLREIRDADMSSVDRELLLKTNSRNLREVWNSLQALDISRWLISKAWADVSCVAWPGRISQFGYGRMEVGRKRARQAHLVVWERLIGILPAGMVIDHLCRNRACVNPLHMEVVTHRENTMRGEGITAVNARKSCCMRGHPLSGENLGYDFRGRRKCIACQQMHSRESYQRKKAARKAMREART